MNARIVSKKMIFCLVGVVALGLTAIAADDPVKKPTEAKSQKKVQKDDTKSARLPAPFGKLGLSDEQRKQIYAVQGSYQDRIEKLKNELKQVSQERDQQIEAILTSGQKDRLKELESEAKAAKEAKKVAADKK
ncbi:MAG TPA: hypothetical protein VNQ76_05105 [Planctomicrobium sp.]|nr:hypothetical protein [Planctomicrobium sp.]